MWVLLNADGEIFQWGGQWLKEGLTKGQVFMRLISTDDQLSTFAKLFDEYPEAETIHEVQTNGDTYLLKGMKFSRSNMEGAK